MDAGYGPIQDHPWPRSAYATGCIQQIAARCPAFSNDMRDWAKNLHPNYLMKREKLRTWWEQNKVYFAKGDYAAVQPLQPASPAPPPPTPVVKAGATPVPAPTTEQQPAAKPAPATPVTSFRSVLIGVILLALAAVLVVVLRRAKHRQS